MKTFVLIPMLSAAIVASTVGPVAATEASGQVEAFARYTGTLVGNSVLVAAECDASTDTDGDSFPDPVSLSMTCTVHQGDQTYEIPRIGNVTNDRLIGVAAAAGVLALDLESFSVCVTANAEFADGTRASDSRCASASVTDL